MVALVGQPSGWPVTLKAGIPTPASVTAIMSVGTQAVTLELYSRREAARY